MSQLVPLELMNPGERGSIVQVDGEPSWINRLAEMGLREGVLVQMIQPGSPCILAIDNHRFSFRGEESAVVYVSLE